MKKILIIAMLLFAVSCATTRTVSTKYDHITLEKTHNALADCDDTNGGRWWMNLGGLRVAVLQLENCLSIDKILVMITDTDEFTSEIRYYSYKLLGLHFLEHMKIAYPNKAWSLKQIKTFDVPASIGNGGTPDEPGKWLVIYKIGSKPLKCSGDTCKIND